MAEKKLKIEPEKTELEIQQEKAATKAARLILKRKAEAGGELPNTPEAEKALDTVTRFLAGDVIEEGEESLAALRAKIKSHKPTPEQTKLFNLHEGALASEDQPKVPWYKKFWQSLVVVNDTANKAEKVFMDSMSPDRKLGDDLFSQYKRYKALKEARKNGFESLSDFHLLDIEINSIQKNPYGRTLEMFAQNHDISHYDIYGSKHEERANIETLQGNLLIEGPLFGAKPVVMEWKAYIYQTKQDAKSREYQVELYWHQSIERVVSGAWADIEVPDFIEKQGIKMGLDSYVNVHVPEYNRYYKGHNKGEAAHEKIPVRVATRMDKVYYIKITRQIFAQLQKYIKQHCFTEEALNPEYVDTKFQVSTEISRQIQAEQEQEIVNGLQRRQFDEKIFYYGEGANKFLQILKSPEYRLANIENQLIEKNLAALSPDLEERTIVDLGAANAFKIVPLLNEQLKNKERVTYVPVDINPAMIFAAAANVNNPLVDVDGLILDFHKPLKDKLKPGPKFLTLLGSTLGNGDEAWQKALLQNISQAMTANDRLAVGINLKTDWTKILAMYETPPGRDFIMETIKSLGFPEDKIELEIIADEEASQIKQVVHIKEDLVIKRADHEIPYRQGEAVTIFVSQKYAINELAQLAESAGLEIDKSFVDDNNQYQLAVLKKGK